MIYLTDCFTIVVLIALWREVRIADGRYSTENSVVRKPAITEPASSTNSQRNITSAQYEQADGIVRRVENIPFERLCALISRMDDPAFERLENPHRQRIEARKRRILEALPGLRQGDEERDSRLSFLQDLCRKDDEDIEQHRESEIFSVSLRPVDRQERSSEG